MKLNRKKVIKVHGEEAVGQDHEFCLHTCPYREDLFGDSESLCDCDPDQVYNCAMDI